MSATQEGDGASESWRPAANPWAIALMVTLATFMEVLDSTIVNVALTHIAGSMSASNDESTWVLTSYLVANGIVLMISGFFTRLLGRKRYFLISIAMFTVCSFLCGIADSLPQLIVSRLFQGFFGGGLQPNQQAIILDTFPRERRTAAFGITAMATIVGPVLGPVIGGLITDNYSWRWIFFINIPVGLIAFLGVAALVEDPPWVKLAAKAKISVDYIGLGLIVLALGAFQVMLDQGENADWFNSANIRFLAALSAAGFAGAITWLLYAKDPIVNLRVMADRNFALGCIMIVAMAMCLYSSSNLLPQLSQQQFGYTATWSGLLLAPGAMGLIVLIVLVSQILPFVQMRYVVAFGFLFLGGAFLYSSRLTPDIDFFNLAAARVLQTLGLGFLFVPISSIAYLTVPKELNGDAASLFTMCRNVAGSVGISLATALVTTRDQVRMAYLGGHLSPLSQSYNTTLSAITRAIQATGSTFEAAQRSASAMLHQTLQTQAEILAYSDVFEVCAALALCIVPLTFLLSPEKGGKSGLGGH